jgi:enoyl-CoA hydratase
LTTVEYQNLRVERDDEDVVTVAFHRPDKYNAIDGVMHSELERVFRELGEDPAVRAVLLTGDGKYFSAGGDAQAILDGAYDPYEKQVFRHAIRLVQALLDVEVPVVAAVNGHAVGLGANLALFCDTVYIDRSAKIGDPHVKFGVAAGDGGAAIWPLLCGVARAKEYLMTGELLTSAEAERVGLVNHVTEDGTAAEEARAYIAKLLALPPLAVRFTKHAINKQVREQVNLVLDTAMALECVTLLSQDQTEAVTSFIEKRPGKYVGR